MAGSIKLHGGEEVPGLDGANVADFWSWAYSNLQENTTRSLFAEYIVGHLLGALGSGRVEWDAVDLRFGDKTVEVKSAAYVQSWQQERLSRISFDIGRKKAWDARSNTMNHNPCRSADCYVFCLYPEKNRELADPLDVPAWRFYVMATPEIDEHFGDQKSVSLSRLRELVIDVDFRGLRDRVGSVGQSAGI